jgi:hypothetical protein
MKLTKKIDFGEYLIIATYDDVNGSLEVSVFDELEDVIESINITNDNDYDQNDSLIKPSLN